MFKIGTIKKEGEPMMKKDILERVVGKIKELKVREEMLLSNFLSMWEKRDLDSVC